MKCSCSKNVNSFYCLGLQRNQFIGRRPPVLLKKRVDFQQFESLIEQKMNSQEDAWNRGDLEGFMNGYWHSDSLKFIGKAGLTYGWDTTLANYKKSYPDTDAMGRLTFDNLSIEMIDSDVILVIGKWMLAQYVGRYAARALFFELAEKGWRLGNCC